MKYLVVVRKDSVESNCVLVETIIEADGFDRTDFDVLFWEYGMFQKENIAIFPIHSIVFVQRVGT